MNRDEYIENMTKRSNYLRSIWNGKMNNIGSELNFIECAIKDNYIIVGNYNKALEKVLLICPNNHNYEVTPSKFKCGDRCPVCSGKSKSNAMDEFYKLIRELNYVLVDEYIDAHTKIRLKCNNGHDLYVSPNSLKSSGTRCTECRDDKLKNDFLELLKNENYKIIGEYINTVTKIELECQNGHKWNTKPSRFKGGVRCPKCRNEEHSLKMLDDDIKKDFLSKLKSNKCSLISEYKISSSKVNILCKHGHITEVIPRNFKYCKTCRKIELYEKSIEKLRKKLELEGYQILSYDRENVTVKCSEGHIYKTIFKYIQQGSRCSICATNNKEYAIEVFNDMAVKEGYKIIGEYNGANSHIDMICPDGHNWTITPKRFRSGERCSICSGTNKSLGETTFYETIKHLKYKVNGKYIGAKTHVNVTCDNGHNWDVTPDNLKRGRRCPHCQIKSQGEEVVRTQLELNNIKFEREKRFDGLTGLGGGKLRFDFYIPKYNSVIEVDGEGHYDLGTFLNNNNTIIHDKIKRNWCIKNNINIFNIKYITLGEDKNKVLKDVECEAISIINSNFNPNYQATV